MKWLRASLIVRTVVLLWLIPTRDSLLADQNFWTGHGPPGGTVYSLATDNRTPGTLFAGTDNGVYRSVAGGDWVRVSAGLPPVQVHSVAVGGDDSTTVVFAGMYNPNYTGQQFGIYKSLDAGASWQPTNNGIQRLDITALSVDPRDPRNLLAGTESGPIFRSVDGGNTWHPAANPNPESVSGIVFAPSDSSTVFAAAGGILKSMDGGDTWSRLPMNLAVDTLAVDPIRPTTVYMGSPFSGILKSIDGGASWFSGNSGLPLDSYRDVLPIRSLAFAPGDPRQLYAAVSGAGIFKSTDGATTWHPASNGLLSPFILSILPVAPSTLFLAAGGGGVWRGLAGSTHWDPFNAGLNLSLVTGLAADPTDNNILYSSTLGGIFKSIDSGESWSPLNDGLSNNLISGIAVSQSNPAVLYAYEFLGGFVKSTDGGLTWRSRNNGLIPSLSAMAVDPSNPSVLYVGTTTSGTFDSIFKSLDGGESWPGTGFNFFNLGVSWLAVDPADSQTVYAVEADLGGVVKSSDGTASWVEVPFNNALCGGANTITIDPSESRRLYVGTTSGVCASIDGGLSWTATRVGPASGYALPVAQILVDRSSPRRLFAAVTPASAASPVLDAPGGAFESLDGGLTWRLLPSDWRTASVTCLLLDKTGHILHAGTSGAGVLNGNPDDLRLLGPSARSRPAAAKVVLRP